MDKEPVTREEQNEQFGFQRKVRFNGEITLGHILTALTMIGVLLGVWRNFDLRMTKLELISAWQTQNIAAVILTVEKLSERRDKSLN